MGMSGSGGQSALGLSPTARNALGIAGDAMAGFGGQPGVFGPAMARQNAQHIPEGAQMPAPLGQHEADHTSYPTGIKGPPVMPGYGGGLAPQSLGDLQHLQHLPPFLQFFMALQGKAHGGSALSAFHNIRNRGM